MYEKEGRLFFLGSSGRVLTGGLSVTVSPLQYYRIVMLSLRNGLRAPKGPRYKCLELSDTRTCLHIEKTPPSSIESSLRVILGTEFFLVLDDQFYLLLSSHIVLCRR